MITSELATPRCGPDRTAFPACPRTSQGTLGPRGPEGGRTSGARPNRLTGVSWATRWPRTVRGRPLSSAHYCLVSRKGKYVRGTLLALLDDPSTH
jgi:hypothetical protein